MKRDSTGYSAFQGDRLDCSVRAHAIAAQIPYAAASALFCEAGRVPGCRTPTAVTLGLYERLGVEPVPTLAAPGASASPWITLTQFLKAHPTGRFVLHRKGHAFAVIDGVVHDWAIGTGPRSRIRRAWRIA